MRRQQINLGYCYRHTPSPNPFLQSLGGLLYSFDRSLMDSFDGLMDSFERFFIFFKSMFSAYDLQRLKLRDATAFPFSRTDNS